MSTEQHASHPENVISSVFLMGFGLFITWGSWAERDQGLDSLVIGSSAGLDGVDGPREVRHGDNEEGVAVIVSWVRDEFALERTYHRQYRRTRCTTLQRLQRGRSSRRL